MGHSEWMNDYDPSRRPRSGRRRGSPWGGAWAGGWGPPSGGPPPWVLQMFGPEFAGTGGAGSRRPRARRGDVRSAILEVLHTAPEPINGYQVIQQIAERSNGLWKPSPGSIYPTIAQLQDEGLVEDAPTGRKAVRLTADGMTYVEDHAAEMSAVWAPFEEHEEDDEAINFKQVIGQTVGAIVQIAKSGTPDQRDKALLILADTRRRLYGLLADGPEDNRDDTGEEE